MMLKSARALLVGAVLSAGLSAWAALPEQTVAVLEYRDTFDLQGTNFIVGTLKTLNDLAIITNSTATSETVVLTVGDGDADSWLGGALYGPVVLRKVGSGALYLDETHFVGDVTIRLEGGTLSGNATAKDDLAVVQSNGVNKAQIDVVGALAVSGTPAFAVPFLGCDTVFFSYASTSSETLALLESAPVAGASDGATITRSVTPEEFRYRAQVPLTGAFSASGGAKARIGDDVVHTFGESGTFTVTSGEGTMEVLIIAGGGGGAVGQGGAGGAGGVVYREALPVSARAEPYEIVVGAGGIGALCAEDSGTIVRSNTSGGNSSAFGLTAIGGGRGAPAGSHGAAGGSGGGNSRLYPQQTHGGAGTEGQGFAGGNGTSYSGGGGGGAGAPGSQGHPSQGGIGRRFDIAGREVGYAGGGAGGMCSVSRMGCGGLADERKRVGLDGLDGAGSGGAAGGFQGAAAKLFGGHGGSGVVIIRYRSNGQGFGETLQGATGGDEIVAYKENGVTWQAHIFRTNGTFTLPAGNRRLQLLAVGGGGGGGGDSGGGGGAGGVLIVSNLFVNAGTYPIEIGAGGPPHNGSNFASNGCPTRAFGFTVPGGGFSRYSTGESLHAMAGASGGGGAYVSNPAWKNTPGVNQYGQALPGYERDYLRGGRAYLGWGHDGGVAQLSNSWGYGYAGGGGGAGEPGHTWRDAVKKGHGGDGVMCAFSGEEKWYGGGGGGAILYGSESQSSAGGAGGGGRGGWYANSGGPRVDGTAGEPNTGGGGGGGSKNGSGGAGGSGIVIIRYQLSPPGSIVIIR
jgi:hypothetical protein